MIHGSSAAFLILLAYFIIVIIVLTLLWRISLALDLIAKRLQEMSQDIKTLASHSDDKKER